jgi:ubiquinol-cytochrome c reductase cytochrome c subunit
MAKSLDILGAAFAMLIASTVLSAQATAPAAPQTAQTVSGNVENGKRAYMKETCFFCHGTVGQGAGNTGARLTPPARNLAGFIRYIRRPTGSMAAYTEKVISDQDLTDIYAYLRSIPPPKPTKDIPLLNQLKQP